MVAEFVLNSL